MLKFSLKACLAMGGLLCAGAAHASSANLGSVAVGSSATATITLTIPNSTVLISVSVLTSGAANLDFTDAGSDTCTVGPSFAANSSCTVNVAFGPRSAGSRYGAVVLTDANGVVATAYLQGTGLGPQVNFFPGTKSNIGSGLTYPSGIAVDGGGNVFIADGGALLKETLSGGNYTQSVISISGLQTAGRIAVDGAGNLYVVDSGHGNVLKLVPSGGSYVQQTIASSSYRITGVAVDGAGNVYIAAGDVLKETPGSDGYTQSVIRPVSYSPIDIAVDGSGSLYLPVLGDFFLVETPSDGKYVQSIVDVAGIGYADGIALDGSGDVFLSASSTNRVLRMTPSAGGYIQTAAVSGVTSPGALAVDGQGNLYVTEDSEVPPSFVAKLDFADPPILNFGSTGFGSTASQTLKAITLANMGNTSLFFPVPQSGENPSVSLNFPYDTGTPTACPVVTAVSSAPSSLAAGEACLLPISFKPPSISAFNGSLVLTDTNLNATAPTFATQTIRLAGVGVKARQSIVFENFPAQDGFNELGFVVRAKGGASGDPITLTVQGPGKLNGNTLLFTGAGKVTVTANQAGNAYYLPAPATSKTVNVTKAPLWVYAKNATRVFGKENPTFGYSIENLDTGKPTTGDYTGAPKLTTTATQLSPVGAYPITIKIGTLASKNYTFSFYSATLTITPIGKARTPIFTPSSGTYQATTTVKISDSTPGAIIFYTLNGAAPTTASTRYTKPIVVSRTETIKALAVARGYTRSVVSTATFNIKKPPS